MAKKESLVLVSEEQLNQWKNKYGLLKIIECDGLSAYFRKPDMKIWRFAVKVVEKSATEFKKAMAVNCFLGGNRQLLESPYVEDIAEVIDEFIDYPSAEI